MNKKKILAAVLLPALIVVSLPEKADAIGMGGLGAFVEGGGLCKVSTFGGNLSTYEQVEKAHKATVSSINSSINSAAQLLNQRIKMDDQAILDQLKRNGAAEKELFKQFDLRMTELMKNQSKAEQILREEELFGEFFKSDSMCASPEAATGAQVGKKAEVKVAGESYLRLKEHNNKGYPTAGAGSFMRKLQAKPSEELTAAVFFPEGNTLDAEGVRKAQEMAEIITNPLPSPELPEKVKTTGAGQDYEAYVKLKETRMAIPQQVLADNIAAVAPTVPLGDWAKDTFAAIGGQGDLPEVKDGKISPMALLDLQVNSRFANTNWHKRLNERSNEKWLLYEIATMNAARMEMERRQLVLLQQIALMMAQDQSARTSQELDGAIRGKYNEAIKLQ